MVRLTLGQGARMAGLGIVIGLASVIPARFAAATDPLIALREA